MVFGNGVKNIQAAAYNGARTVYEKDNLSIPICNQIDNGDTRYFLMVG